MKLRLVGWRQRRRLSVHYWLISIAVFTVLGLVILTLKAVDPTSNNFKSVVKTALEEDRGGGEPADFGNGVPKSKDKGCATVEEMGEIFGRGFREESLRVRKAIQDHFAVNGALRVRGLPAEQFCKHGFVIAKASEAGLGNEMYKILTAAALSVMLNRSLIIGQTRHIGATIGENGKNLLYVIRFQNTTDAVAIQFFLKNVHMEMRMAASDLFGKPENLQYRPNVFGELMRVLISPSENVERAVEWALGGEVDPDIALHMRMLMNRSVRAMQAALSCVKKAMQNLQLISRPKIILVSDSPSFLKEIAPSLGGFADVSYSCEMVLHFDYEHFNGNMTGRVSRFNELTFRLKDWGPAPRWVAFVDFFLASRARYAVISGANRRVGTTYAQLIAALAAAHQLDDDFSARPNFTFFSSFQNNLVSEGLKNQVGWGHVWNRFAGPLSCHNQPNQCAFTPLLPPAWWDGLWQSPIPRDVRRMEAYGIQLSGFGTLDDAHLHSFCRSRKDVVVTVQLI